MPRATDVIQGLQDDFGDSTGAYYTDALMLRWLNESANEIAMTTKCISRPSYRAKVADQWQYALEPEFLSVQDVLYRESGEKFYPLQPRALSQILRSRYTFRTGRPAWFDVWGSAREEKRIDTATGGSANTMIHAGLDFTAIALVGDLIFNLTDDSEGVITSVAGDTVTFSEGLNGGTDNTFASGDQYQITSPDSSFERLIIHPAPATSDTVGEESIALWGSFKHRLFQQSELNAANDYLELDEELITPLRHYIRNKMHLYEKDLQMAEYERGLYKTTLHEQRPNVKERIDKIRSVFIERFSMGNVFSDIGITAPNRVIPPYFGF